MDQEVEYTGFFRSGWSLKVLISFGRDNQDFSLLINQISRLITTLITIIVVIGK